MVPYFVSVEQANKSNIQKFANKKDFFQKIIDTSIDIYLKQSKTYLTAKDLPISMVKKLKNIGVDNFEIYIENNEPNIHTIAHFYTERFWYNDVLNNVIIYYNSNYFLEKCNSDETVLKARVSSICLSNGWFFEIDTDWL
jgi:hypothetical protein